MANKRADEPRTYIRVGVTFARMITAEAKEHGLSVPEYLKDKRVVPVTETGYPGGSTRKPEYFLARGEGGEH